MLALENKFQGQVEFVVVDVDDKTQGQLLADRFNVDVIPAIFIMDTKGNIAYQQTGVVSEKELAGQFKQILGK